jgi:dTDP-4-dehydrorhamnose reductase
MKILVTGVTGQLGYDVLKEGVKRGFEIKGIGSEDLDITNEYAVNNYINTFKPDAIIHCAAYTAVDKAETDRDYCWKVNVEGTKYLANTARQLNIKFMYISTDYVFDGVGELPFDETTKPNPVGFYGLTKYEGEKIVQSMLSKMFIVRISWVFGLNGNNFVKTMLRLAETHDEINVVGDQVGSPTNTFDLSLLLLDMVQTEKYGIYHATNEGFCSWAEFANEIFCLAGKNTKVNVISSEEYPTLAVRPKNSRLSNQNLINNKFIPLQPWRVSLENYIKALKLEVK